MKERIAQLKIRYQNYSSREKQSENLRGNDLLCLNLLRWRSPAGQ